LFGQVISRLRANPAAHNGNSRLMIPSHNGNADTTRLLLRHGADVAADNGCGMTPLMFAATFGGIREVEQLKGHGASLQHRNHPGLSACFMARVSRRIARLCPRNQSYQK
jgi:ankyrin repeat protein